MGLVPGALHVDRAYSYASDNVVRPNRDGTAVAHPRQVSLQVTTSPLVNQSHVKGPLKTGGTASPSARAQAGTSSLWRPESMFSPVARDSSSQQAEEKGGAAHGEEEDDNFQFRQLEKPASASAEALAERAVYTGITRVREPSNISIPKVQERPSTADDLVFARSSDRDAIARISTTSSPALTPAHSPLRPRTTESHLYSEVASGSRHASAQHVLALQQHSSNEDPRSRQLPPSRPGTGFGQGLSIREGQKLRGTVPPVARASSAPPVNLIWKDGVGLVGKFLVKGSLSDSAAPFRGRMADGGCVPWIGDTGLQVC